MMPLNLPPSYLLILAALALPSLVGVMLAIWGLIPRRIADGPHCRACGYNLSGCASERCSECGNDLSRPRATKQGKFQRRWGRAATGIVLAILFAPPALVGGWSALRGDRWDAWLPTSVLLFDLAYGSSPAIDPTARALGAVYRSGQLSQQQCDEIVAVVARRSAAHRRDLLNTLPGFDLTLEMYGAESLSAASAERLESVVLEVDDVFVQSPVVLNEQFAACAIISMRTNRPGFLAWSRISRVLSENDAELTATGLESIGLYRSDQAHSARFPTCGIRVDRPGRIAIEFEVSTLFRKPLRLRQPPRWHVAMTVCDAWVCTPPDAPNKMVACAKTAQAMRVSLENCLEILEPPPGKSAGTQGAISTLRFRVRVPSLLPVAIHGDLYVSWDATSDPSDRYSPSDSLSRQHLGRLDFPSMSPVELSAEWVTPSRMRTRTPAQVLIEFIPCDVGGHAALSETGALADKVTAEAWPATGRFDEHLWSR